MTDGGQFGGHHLVLSNVASCVDIRFTWIKKKKIFKEIYIVKLDTDSSSMASCLVNEGSEKIMIPLS